MLPCPIQLPAARSHAPESHSLSFAQARQLWLVSSQTGLAAEQLALVMQATQTLARQ